MNHQRITKESPKNHQRITKESLKIYSGKIVKEKGLTKPN